MSYLSQEERDRVLLTWGNNDGYSYKMKLHFNENESLYTYDLSEDIAGNSWRNEDYIIYRNYQENRLTELQETLGKTYLIKDNLQKPKWRIMNELKEIQGFMCMKAITKDTVKGQEIVAWFAANIPVPVGPESFYGLPGAILGLEIDNGNVLIEAEKISLSDEPTEVKLPKKMKGREINLTGLNELIVDHIKISTETRRNPYWSMRY